MTDQVNTTAYKTIYTQHPGLIKDYLSALATDPNFYENEDLYSAGDNLFEAQKYWLYYLSGSDSAGKAGLIGYFDQRAETAEDLDHISTTQELAQLLYRYQPGDYIYDYSEAQGYHLIDTVLGETPGVTEGGHLAFIRKRMDPGLATQVDVTLSQAEVRIKDRIWLAEHHLYGSSRLGMRRYPSGAFYNSWDYTGETPEIDTNLQVKQPWYSAEYNDVIQAGYGEPYGHTQTQTYKMQHTLGAKGYELSNHLGNVQVVVTDKKFERDLDDDDTVDVYAPSLTAAYDYYPFGMLMPGRYVRDTTKLGWRHKFNGMEADDELKGLGNSLDFGARMYSGRLGRWMSVDPLFRKYPSIGVYAFGLNNPVFFIDKDGREVFIHGSASNQAFIALQSKTSLELTFNDKTGQVSYTGVPKTKMDKELIRAFAHTKIQVNLHTTNISHRFTSQEGDQKGILIGANDGSEMDMRTNSAGKKEEFISTIQYINMEHSRKVEKAGLSKQGTDVYHEVMESFYQAEDNPGEPYSEASFKKAHNKVLRLDKSAKKLKINYNSETKQIGVRETKTGKTVDLIQSDMPPNEK